MSFRPAPAPGGPPAAPRVKLDLKARIITNINIGKPAGNLPDPICQCSNMMFLLVHPDNTVELLR